MSRRRAGPDKGSPLGEKAGTGREGREKAATDGTFTAPAERRPGQTERLRRRPREGRDRRNVYGAGREKAGTDGEKAGTDGTFRAPAVRDEKRLVRPPFAPPKYQVRPHVV
jgi:hypothetical protein